MVESNIKILPNAKALSGEIRPVATGRFMVLCIILSISRSYHIFIAADPELASAIANIIVIAKNKFKSVLAIMMPVIAVNAMRIKDSGLVSSI